MYVRPVHNYNRVNIFFILDGSTVGILLTPSHHYLVNQPSAEIEMEKCLLNKLIVMS